MPAVGLFFIGAVLTCNGLSLLGRVEPRGAAPINAFVGTVLVAIAARLAVPSGATETDLIGAAGFLLFGLTYLWVALSAWTRHPTDGLGWYCLWATGVSAFLGIAVQVHEGDTKLALLWLLWVVLFATFFALLALGRSALAAPAGWLAIMEGLVTASIPGGLLIIGEWSSLATAWVVVATIATLGAFALLVARGTPPGRP
jgi:putative amide transporter protein